MRIFLLCMALFPLSACGDNQEQVNSEKLDKITSNKKMVAPTEQKPAQQTATQEGPAQQVVHEPPWGIPIMPEARYIRGWTKFTPVTKKRDEAVATIAVKGDIDTIVNYYEQELPKHGFEITSNEYGKLSAAIRSENKERQGFRINAIRGGEAEVTMMLIAVKPKLSE